MTDKRKDYLLKAANTALAFTVVNLLWEVCFGQDWMEALKISYFQSFSLLYVAWRWS